MQQPSEVNQARYSAMNLLARREHSYVELERKLKQRGFADSVIEQALQRLQEQGLQSDQRFVESFIRARANSGKGPLRVREELQQKGIANSLISQGMQECECDWQQQLQAVWQKKFGVKPSNDKEKAQQLRFLSYRGFSSEAIFRLLNHSEYD